MNNKWKIMKELFKWNWKSKIEIGKMENQDAK